MTQAGFKRFSHCVGVNDKEDTEYNIGKGKYISKKIMLSSLKYSL